MTGEDRTQADHRLSRKDRISLFIGLLIAFIGLIPSITGISGYWKLGSAVAAVGIGAIVLFVSSEAWRKRIRPYIWVGTLIIGTVVGLIVDVQVFSRDGHPIWTPPDASTVTVLMNEEVAATLDHDIVRQIYAPDAFVEDAACRPAGGSRTWIGVDQIMARYQGLGRFASLQHVNAKVQWQPDNSLADQATVTAQTLGKMESRGGSLQPVYGNEVWHFARLPNGRWVITSFTYHVCLPPS